MSNTEQAIKHLQQGHIIAYPTEAVYGLGCDPYNEQAVLRLFTLKERNPDKGIILIAANWTQITPLIEPLTQQQYEMINKTWPGPMTWVFPASTLAPTWIIGKHNTIALRITAHPIANNLCERFKNPIVSTSANLSGQTPAKSALEVQSSFSEVDFILEGPLGDLTSPTPIRDARTGIWYRK
jgi:L-threonylcarbamoyladenylate synthase